MARNTANSVTWLSLPPDHPGVWLITLNAHMGGHSGLALYSLTEPTPVYAVSEHRLEYLSYEPVPSERFNPGSMGSAVTTMLPAAWREVTSWTVTYFPTKSGSKDTTP